MDFVKNKRTNPAFTLVEMLVALALIGTIVTMVYGSFNAASRSLDLYGSRLACDDRACLVLRLLTRQLRCAYRPSFETNPAPAPAAANAPAAPGTSGPPAPLESNGADLSFLTTAGLGAAPALWRVQYRHDPATGTLSVCCEPYLYGAVALPSAESWRPILTGVRTIEVQCYDGRQWQSGWTATSRTLPQSVKIALTVSDEKNRVHEFQTMVSLGGWRALPQESVAAGTEKR
jgi:prepilin-type N-terminal cleavage/methylation domain-containing protein